MSAKKEIKVPPALIWREIRMRYLPVGMFLCAFGVAFHLWQVTVVGPTMVGEVETVQAPVTTLEAGILTNLLVRPMQVVQAGEPVAELIVTDVRSASSRVQDLRSQISLSQLEIDSIFNRERWASDYEGLRLSMARFHADLLAARAQMPTLEADVERNAMLLKERIVATNVYEESLRLRDSVKAWIPELEGLVTNAENRLREADNARGVLTNLTRGGELAAALKRVDAGRMAIESKREPIILRAPITGTVGNILHREGENVREGEVILTIHALEGDRIVAYMRQGSSITPTKGMPVRIRCRSRQREEAVSKVEEIGFRYEPITNHALIRPGAPFELGMPIGVTMPPSFRTLLRPGELVDLAIEP